MRTQSKAIISDSSCNSGMENNLRVAGREREADSMGKGEGERREGEVVAMTVEWRTTSEWQAGRERLIVWVRERERGGKGKWWL